MSGATAARFAMLLLLAASTAVTSSKPCTAADGWQILSCSGQGSGTAAFALSQLYTGAYAPVGHRNYEAELLHARWAMLAAVGALVPEVRGVQITPASGVSHISPYDLHQWTVWEILAQHA
jgi:hypothetical protein